jgi:Berberine and berberine like
MARTNLPTLITVRQKYDLKNLFRYSRSIPVPA